MKSNVLNTLAFVSALGINACNIIPSAEAGSYETTSEPRMPLSPRACAQLRVSVTNLRLEIDRINKNIVSVTAERENLYNRHGPLTTCSRASCIARERALARQIDAASSQLTGLAKANRVSLQEVGLLLPELATCDGR